MDLPKRLLWPLLVIFLIYVLLFSSDTPTTVSRREFKNARLDDLVWRFIYGVRNCLRMETDPIELRSNPFPEYWRRLPAISDSCGVNPQMSVRAYPTSKQFNFYYVQNMNKTVENEKCTILSQVRSSYPRFEGKFKQENPSCDFVNYNKTQKELIKEVKGGSRVNALYAQFDTVSDAHDLLDALQSESTVCQINLLYPEPSERKQWQFVNDFNKLLTEGNYLLLKAEKDFSSTFVNVFIVNFSDEFCRSRYFRMYTFD